MSRLYKNLKAQSISEYGNRSRRGVTQQIPSEKLFIIRGKDKGCEAHHYILVPDDKINDLRNQGEGKTINITQFGRVVEHDMGPASAWGKDPPPAFKKWIESRYESDYFDDIGEFPPYEKDDIRFCVMQRAILSQRIGVLNRYHRQEHTYHILLDRELQIESTLAYRAGIKNNDVVISMNGIATKDCTYDQCVNRWRFVNNLPSEVLVCDWATYMDYKNAKQIIHQNLPTVQHCKPVFATTTTDSHTDEKAITFDENIFCTVRMKEDNTITIIPQSTVFKSPEFTQVNDICFVEIDGEYKKVKILCIGSYKECELSKINAMQTRTYDTADNKSTKFEELPNELILDIFSQVGLQYLYNAFWGLNLRLNMIFQSTKKLSFTFNDYINDKQVALYGSFVTELVIDTYKTCDLHLFPNVEKLTILNTDSDNLNQIDPETLPCLTHLTILLGADFTAPSQLIENIFSNKFPSIQYVNLGWIVTYDNYSWSVVPSLRFIAVRLEHMSLMSDILMTCPNLDHLQLHISKSTKYYPTPASPITYPLRRLTLWSDTWRLTLSTIVAYLSVVPDVQHLYLQTVYTESLVVLAENLVQELKHLSRFDCHIKIDTVVYDTDDILTSLCQVHPCFTRVKCIEEEGEIRKLFVTD